MIKEVLPMLLGTPYQFQIESAEVLWNAKYGLSADEMGLGKSLEAIMCVAAHMIERSDAKIIVCVPAFLKANWDREFNKFTIHIRVKTCFSSKDIPEKWDGFDVVIMNYEQLEKSRHLFRKATMVVSDECFVAGTMIDTPDGPKPIEWISVGSKILNCTGEDEVVAINSSITDCLITINNQITCTPSHPFFTQRGWVIASMLKKGDYLVRTDETMRMVQDKNIGKEESLLQQVLFSEMENVSTRNQGKSTQQRSSRKNIHIKYREETSDIFCVAQEKQLHVQSRSAGKGKPISESDEPQAKGSWWKWMWPNEIRKNSIKYAWDRLGLQPRCHAKQSPIQNRCRSSKKEDSNRSRWKLSLSIGKKSARQKEGSVVKGIRVESIEVEKCRGRAVYNLQIKKHPSYSVNGVLVHNCHYLKSHDSKRTQFFTNYLHDYRPDRVILLSGTPIKNRIPEYFSILRILDLNRGWKGYRLGMNRYVQFCDYFCHREERRIPGKRFAEVKWVGFKNEKDFFNLLDGRYVRHMSKNVLDLPPIIHQDIITKKLPTPGDDVLENELRELWEMYLMGIESQFLASRKVESALLKVPYTIQVVEDFLESGNGPIVVFTDHINSAKVMGEKWKKRGFVITGMTPIPVRDRVVQQFQNGEIDVLVATTGTMSAGWTLTKACRAVFNDLPWVPGDFAQAIKRIHRIGQDEKCFIYNVVTTELDRMIMGTLREKTGVLNTALKQTH